MSLPMIKLIALDFDGTTADTMPTLEEYAVELIVQYYALEEEEARTQYRSTTGLPFVQQIGMLFPGNDNNITVVEQYEQKKLEGIFDLPLFKDSIETITYFRANNYKVAISSSSTQPIIEKYCLLKGLEVDEILGYRKGFEKGKDHFDHLMKAFNLSSKEIVYIGDSLKDCERAQNNDILFIGRIGMFSQEQFDVLSKSHLYIHELAELKELIPTLNQD